MNHCWRRIVIQSHQPIEYHHNIQYYYGAVVYMMKQYRTYYIKKATIATNTTTKTTTTSSSTTTTSSNTNTIHSPWSNIVEDMSLEEELEQIRLNKIKYRDHIKRLALHELHMEIGCKMIPYGKYLVPHHYHHMYGGILKEHLWCRTPGRSTIFDISYMTQCRIFGKDRVKFIESLVPCDIQNLKIDHAKFTCITNEVGGIIDATIISQCDDNIYMVTNGINRNRLLEHFEKYIDIAGMKGQSVFMYMLEKSHSLVAIQGSGAAAAIQPLLNSNVYVHKIPYMTGIRTPINDIESCRITRCGFTGEDGFELCIPHGEVEEIVIRLLENQTVNIAGLGARDTLRMEAGLPYHTIDIDTSTTPIEAGYQWILGKPNSRRYMNGGYVGDDHIFHIPQSVTCERTLKPIPRIRVGIMGMDRPARAKTKIYDITGTKEIGYITSGIFSPTLRRPISMGYISIEYSAIGTPILLSIRDQMIPASISSMPFITTQYYRYKPNPDEIIEESTPPQRLPQYNTIAKARREQVESMYDDYTEFF